MQHENIVIYYVCSINSCDTLRKNINHVQGFSRKIDQGQIGIPKIEVGGNDM